MVYSPLALKSREAELVSRIHSLGPRSRLSDQDVILPAIQVQQESEPSEGVRSLELAVATTHYALGMPAVM